MNKQHENNPKVVFLDVDGVMLDQDWLHKIHKQIKGKNVPGDTVDRMLFEPKRVARLNRITQATNAKIVMSSSWRTLYNSLEEIEDLFQDVGIEGEIIGTTGKNRESRALEITTWLDEHPEVTHFVVLDDCPVALEDERLERHAIKTKWFAQNHLGGLQDEHVAMAIEVLSRQREIPCFNNCS